MDKQLLWTSAVDTEEVVCVKAFITKVVKPPVKHIKR